MDFRFTDDQLTLTTSVRDYLSGTHGPEVLRQLDANANRDPAIWQGLVDMGLTGLLVPEAHGERARALLAPLTARPAAQSGETGSATGSATATATATGTATDPARSTLAD